MRSNNPFRISALNSLKINQVQVKDQKQLNNTFKGASDLRKQLNKNKNSSISAYKQTLQSNTKHFSSTMINLQKPHHQVLMDEVAALDNFKPAITRQKTKNMIQNIKLRRRQKHIQAYNHFKQDLDDYKENLLSIYQSLYNDSNQVLSIKQSQLNGYYQSQTDEYMLGREKEILEEFQMQLQMYKRTCKQKLIATREQLQRIKDSRGTVVEETCQMLRLQLIQIAFVLQDQARQIQYKQKQQIIALQQKFYLKYSQLITQLQSRQNQKNITLENKMQQVTQHWKQLKQTFQINQFKQMINSQQYNNPLQRQLLYNSLIKLQTQNHAKKSKALESLIMNEHVDSLRKVNIDKWYQVVKSINDQFDRKLDDLVKKLMQEDNFSKQKHQKLIVYLERRLKYIRNHSQQEIAQMIANQYNPLVEGNNNNVQQLMKKATNYVQLNDQKENLLIQNLYKFFTSIAIHNDDFVKDFAALNQKYQIEKAKILDDDQEKIQKLEKQLSTLKVELRESLHHLKLEEVEKKCFEKIDQMEQAYRLTHQNNKTLASLRPQSLNSFVLKFQQKMAGIFQLYQQSKKAQLIEKNKQQAQKQALKRIEQEDKKKLEQEQKQAEILKKNGGKAPPAAKPKDPKKLAAQIQQRKKAILAQMGQKKIQQLKTGSGNTWLVYRSLLQISKQFYKSSNSEQAIKEQNQPPKQQQSNQQQIKPLQVDQLPQSIINKQGQKITTNQTIFKTKQISQLLLKLRDNIFQNIDTKKIRILSQSTTNDQQMLEQSLMTLDERLKKHYSLKGQLESQIFLKRSGQITNHKKRYEKYARTVRQKMDLQTQRFNFLLEKSLQQLKNHNTLQKQTRQLISTGKTISQLQGMLSKARQNYNKFTQQINQIVSELNHLSKTQVQILLQKNQDFIKQSKPLNSGGEYSEQQIKWYEQMMKQITDQIKIQQVKRQQKTKEVLQSANKRKKQLLDKFQKQYHTSIQDLSAKDGTGKVYGKPKRTAQQKTRLEMNKCQQAQITIHKQIDTLIQIFNREKSNGFRFQKRPQTLVWRRKLMTVFTCIQKYAKHLQALKKDLKIKSMIRVNYDQNLPQCSVVSQQEDKKLIEEEMKQLGPLAEQKQDKPFMKYILDIQKIISDQSRTIYIGDKAKYLTGADKLPDFLRKYIASMKQSAEDFRQNSVRQLRESCMKLSDLCQKLSELFIFSLESYFIYTGNQKYITLSKFFNQLYNRHQKQKTQNLRLLRPNLSNPKCQQQLKNLNQKQLSREKQFIQSLKLIKQNFKSEHFTNGQTFINSIINNYQFLLQYSDSLYLFEDFIKVNGDDDQEKQKLNIKKLMLMKQKGINIDSSSERNLKKKWQGINFTIINFDDKKYSYKKVQVQETNSKDAKKGAKKDAKKPIQQAVSLQNQSKTRQIQTFKTWRQKSVFQCRQKCLQQFSQRYRQIYSQMSLRIDQSIKQNQLFNTKWVNIASQLFLK